MRRRLHTLLIALLTLALSTDAARACWFLRTRRQYRPAIVSRHCPPPAWSGCGEMVVVQERSVHEGCCQPVVCPPAAACCEGSMVVSQESALASEAVVDRDAESPTQSVVREQPTAAGVDQAPAAPAEPQPEPPASRSELVQPASNNEPLPDLEPVEPDAELPAGVPKGDSPLTGTVPEEMADEVPPPPRRPLPPLPGIDDDEPPMDEEAAEPAIKPAAPADPAPAVEPAPTPETNLFEEFEDGAAAGDDPDEEMASEEEAGSPFPSDDEPAPPAQPAAEPADLPVDDDPVAADDDEAPMADEEDTEAAEPASPFDTDDEPVSPPAEESDPFAEALAAAEPVRRWIHASGAHSLVARLVEVDADGGCLLETDGRRIRVPVANLSGHDRDYLRAAGVRLAALRDTRERAAAAAATTAPQATDTAGL